MSKKPKGMDILEQKYEAEARIQEVVNNELSAMAGESYIQDIEVDIVPVRDETGRATSFCVAVRVTLVVLMLVLAGCGTSGVPRSTQTLVYDFRPYTEQGFLITPEEYQGDYRSVGIIAMEIVPAASKEYAYEKEWKEYEEVEGTYRQGDWAIEEMSTQDVIDQVYEQAQGMGADAIMNFEVMTDTEALPGESLVRPVFVVRGFAIDRATTN